MTSTARLRRETSWFHVLWRTWTYDDEFSFIFMKANNILKNSTPGKVACIWHIERVQIDAIKFDRTQIHFFYRRFHCGCRRSCLRSLIGLTQRRRRRLRKRHLKGKFALPQTYSIPFNFSNVGKLFWSWILKDCIKVQEKKKKVVVFCSRPPLNVKLGSCSRATTAKKSVQKSWCTCKVVVLLV